MSQTLLLAAELVSPERHLFNRVLNHRDGFRRLRMRRYIHFVCAEALLARIYKMDIYRLSVQCPGLYAVISRCRLRRSLRQHILLIEVRRIGDAVHFLVQLIQLILNSPAVRVCVDVIGCLRRQLHHTIQDILCLLKRCIRRLQHTDAIL